MAVITEEHGALFAFNTSMLHGAIIKRNLELHVRNIEALTLSFGIEFTAIL